MKSGISTTADLTRQIELLAEKNCEIEKRCERLEANQYKAFYVTINRRPLLKKYTCELVNPERKLLNQMLERGCALVDATHSKKYSRYKFKKKL